MAEEPQSPSGDQGTDAADSGYAQYLDSVAPEIREQVEPLFKEFDGNVTKKFQEHAEYRKGWAPYEEAGIKDVPPETLQELLTFAQMASDPNQGDQFNEWLKSVAEERGVFGDNSEDLELDDFEDSSSKQIEDRLIEKVTELINPINERFQQQDQEQTVQAAEKEINETFDAIMAETKLPEDARDAIEALAYHYTDEPGLSGKEVIEKGLADYQKLIGQGEKSLFAQKENQPQTPEGPGAASTSPESISSFDDPRLKAQAVERIRNSR